jgi:hypothetical protein
MIAIDPMDSRNLAGTPYSKRSFVPDTLPTRQKWHGTIRDPVGTIDIDLHADDGQSLA